MFGLFNLLPTERKNQKLGRQWSHPVDVRQLHAKALRRPFASISILVQLFLRGFCHFLPPQAVFCEGPSRSWFAASRMSLRRLYNVLEESLMWCDMYSIALQRLPRRHGGARMWLLKKISPRIYKGELWGRWGCAQVVEMYCIKERQRENGREPERSMQCFKLSLDNWLYWTRFDARSWIHMFPSSFLSFFLFFFGWRMPSFIT